MFRNPSHEVRMGEQQQGTLFRPEFNRATRIQASEAALTEDAGSLVLRQVADRLGLDDAVAEHLYDRRDVARVTHSLPSLIRTAALLFGQGWVDQDDADALRGDRAVRVAVADGGGWRAADRPLASQPTMSRLMSMLSDDAVNRDGLHAVVRKVAFRDIALAHGPGRRGELTIDFDSYPDAAHGHQEGAVYNGHYHETCLHPLIAIADTGHVLDGRMRPGNVHTAQDVIELAGPLFEDARKVANKVWARFDAGFVGPGFMDWLDQERIRFVSRLRNNAVLEREAASFVARTRAVWAASPADRPREETFEFWYRAGTWSRKRRVVAVLVERQDGDGELFDRLFFLVTNASRPTSTSAELLARYRRRGSAENHIGEFVNVIGPKISSPLLRENETTMLLGILAYTLVHHVRTRLAAHLHEGMSLQRVRERFLKAAAVIVRHARRIVVRIGEAKVRAWRTLVDALGYASSAGSEVAPAF
jgi:hypothetical protein